MNIKDIRKVMDYIIELDSGVGLTEDEWIDVLDDFEEKYGENASVTAKRLEIYFRDED